MMNAKKKWASGLVIGVIVVTVLLLVTLNSRPFKIRALIKKLRSAESASQRIEAAKSLADMRDPRTIPALIEALSDENLNVRSEIVYILPKFDDPRVFEAIVSALRDSSSDVRDNATWCLGRLKDPRAIKPLIQTLMDDENHHVREVAAIALGKIENTPSMNALYWLIKVDSKRKEAISILAEAKDTRILPFFLACLKDQNPDVRKASACILASYEDPCVIPSLIQALNDPSWKVRKNVVQALGKVGDSQAIDSLLTSLQLDPVSYVCESAAMALGEIGDDRAVPYLAAELKRERDWSKDTSNRWAVDEVKVYSIDALGKIGGKIAVGALVEALTTQDYECQEHTKKALLSIGGSNVVSCLIQELQSDSEKTRETAANLLGRLGDSCAVQPLISALKDHSREVQLCAAAALGRIRSPSAITPLLNLLKESEYRAQKERIHLSNWRRNLHKMSAFEKQFLVRPNGPGYTELVAKTARDALVQIGPPTVDSLLKFLDDQEHFLKKSVCKALGEIGDKRAVPKLLELLDDQDYSLKKSVCKALGEIGDKRAIPKLLEKLTCWQCNPDVAIALNAIGWKPANARELIHLLVGFKNGYEIRQKWDLAREILLQDVESERYQDIENALSALICIGDVKLIPILVEKLNRKGNKSMAEAYLNCGHTSLYDAARAWAKRHGYSISPGSGEFRGQWGSW